MYCTTEITVLQCCLASERLRLFGFHYTRVANGTLGHCSAPSSRRRQSVPLRISQSNSLSENPRL